MAPHHRVGIHDPGHRLRIRVHIRRWNVLIRPDQRQNLAGIPAGHALQFALRHPLRVADYSALGAAKRHIHHRRLPGHPRSQCFHFVQRHVRDDSGVRPCRGRALHYAARDILSVLSPDRYPFSLATILPGSVSGCAALAAVPGPTSTLPPPYQTGFVRCEMDSALRGEPLAAPSEVLRRSESSLGVLRPLPSGSVLSVAL